MYRSRLRRMLKAMLGESKLVACFLQDQLRNKRLTDQRADGESINWDVTVSGSRQFDFAGCEI